MRAFQTPDARPDYINSPVWRRKESNLHPPDLESGMLPYTTSPYLKTTGVPNSLLQIVSPAGNTCPRLGTQVSIYLLIQLLALDNSPVFRYWEGRIRTFFGPETLPPHARSPVTGGPNDRPFTQASLMDGASHETFSPQTLAILDSLEFTLCLLSSDF